MDVIRNILRERDELQQQSTTWQEAAGQQQVRAEGLEDLLARMTRERDDEQNDHDDSKADLAKAEGLLEGATCYCSPLGSCLWCKNRAAYFKAKQEPGS